MRSARRFQKPRKIGGEHSSDDESTSKPESTSAAPADSIAAGDNPTEPSSIPSFTKRTARKPGGPGATGKPKTKLSFGIDDGSGGTAGLGEREEDAAAGIEEFKIKKSALSRKAMEKAAALKAGGRGGMGGGGMRIPLPPLGDGDGSGESVDGGGGRYSKEYLEELRSATPTTLHEAVTTITVDGDDDDNDVDMLDRGAERRDPSDPLGTLAKFGTTSTAAATTAAASSIPDAATIKLLKSRRAAAAKPSATTTSSKSKDYISLSRSPTPASNGASDDDLTTSRRKPRESRLTRTEIFASDDEELASFVNDDPNERILPLPPGKAGRQALLAERKRRQDMIQDALDQISTSPSATSSEGENSDIDHSDSDTGGRKHGWEYDQLRKATGLSNLRITDPNLDPTVSLEARLRYIPPNIPPPPTLSDGIARLEGLLMEMVKRREETMGRLQGLREEMQGVRRREGEVQEGLKRMAGEYEKQGLGKVGVGENDGVGVAPGTPAELVGMGRGLESLGGTPGR